MKRKKEHLLKSGFKKLLLPMRIALSIDSNDSDDGGDVEDARTG